MTKRRISRWSIALTIGMVVAVAQLGALAAMFFLAWQDFSSPSSMPFGYPSTYSAQVMRGELVIPVCGDVFNQYRFQPQQVIRLQAIDLETGRVRNIETPDAGNLLGVVSNGERLWFFDGTNRIHEFDGTKVVELQTKGLPNAGDRMSWPFIYEKMPAFIDKDRKGNFRLRVLVDDAWQDKGQIALPGKARSWSVDELTGHSVLAPLTSANAAGKASTWLQLRVFAVNGQHHLFQTEGQYTSGTGGTQTLIYRNGFDFVVLSSGDEPVSALVPENAMADTTGWVLLDPQLANYPLHTLVSSNEVFLLTKGLEVWRQIRSDGNESFAKFEPIAKVDAINCRGIALVSTADSRQVYAIARPIDDALEFYRLEDRQLQRLPFRIDGMSAPAQRWMARQFFEGLAILSIGTLLLISLAASWTGTMTYSFGHDSVVLASLVRRSMARCVDLFMIFGPLTLQSLFLFQFRFNASIPRVMMAWFEDRQQLMILIPAVVWLIPAWIAFVISTGIWGITPGKWLFGIRVVRTTLRPCGILQALLRELLLAVDVPQLLTAIPGVMCMIVTEKRQRIGDLAADTLVVVAAKRCAGSRQCEGFVMA